jgi:hypothetical protein
MPAHIGADLARSSVIPAMSRSSPHLRSARTMKLRSRTAEDQTGRALPKRRQPSMSILS